MPVLPIDLTAIVAVIMGISIVLVPVIGLTARFALKPLVQSMDTAMVRLSDVADFHNELRP